MNRLIIVVGLLTTLLGLWWAFTNHLIRIGQDECKGVSNAALVKQLHDQMVELQTEINRNADLQRQHDADQKRIDSGSDLAGITLKHVRVCNTASHSSPLPEAPAASGSGSGPASPVNGGAGAGAREVDLTPIIPELKGCEMDASELNIAKSWIKDHAAH